MQPGRRFVRGLIVFALVLVIAGFGVAALDPSLGGDKPTAAASSSPTATGATPRPAMTATPAMTPTPTPSPGSSPSSPPTPTATAVPARSPGFATSGDTVFYLSSDGSRLAVVTVPGLTVQIQSGRAVYYAAAGNKYGLKTGSYAGEFLPLVTMGQADGSSAQTGAAVLAGAVVNRLTTDALSHIADPSSRWIIALPVDIRGARAAFVDVSFDSFGLAAIANTPRVLITFPGSLPLVESVPSNGGVHVLVEGLNVTSWQVIDPARLTLPANKIDAAKAMNQLIFYGSGAASLNFDQFLDGHLGVGTPIMDVSGDVSVSLAVNGSHADIHPLNILQVAGVPVFVAASS